MRILRVESANSHYPIRVDLRVQVSPDGIHWCDEGSGMSFSGKQDTQSFVRVSHYGGWLRLAEKIIGDRVWALVHLALKA